VPDEEPVEIVLRFKNDVGKYIETQPLHLSQKLVSQSERTHDFSYFLAVNSEFIGIVLGWQEHVEVVSPWWFRRQIRETIGKMGEQYL
jgi:predicted DNA-binding transcriptional regulator YafY